MLYLRSWTCAAALGFAIEKCAHDSFCYLGRITIFFSSRIQQLTAMIEVNTAV